MRGAGAHSTDEAARLAKAYMAQYDFAGESLEAAMRRFMRRVTLEGESQQRARLLRHFADRFYACNRSDAQYRSAGRCHHDEPVTRMRDTDTTRADAVFSLAFAALLLNTDLHNSSVAKKMSLNDFIRNCAGCNDGADFPGDVLKVAPQPWYAAGRPADRARCARVGALQQHQTAGNRNALWNRHDDQCRGKTPYGACMARLSAPPAAPVAALIVTTVTADADAIAFVRHTIIADANANTTAAATAAGAKKQHQRPAANAEITADADCAMAASAAPDRQIHLLEDRSGLMAIDRNAPVLHEGVLWRKVVMESTTARARNRQWSLFRVILRGAHLQFVPLAESADHGVARESSWLCMKGALVRPTRSTATEPLLCVRNAFASTALDYTKRPHVFRLETAVFMVLLLQAANEADMLAWMSAINRVAARESALPLAAPVGSQSVWLPPMMPTSPSTLDSTAQLASHRECAETASAQLERHLAERAIAIVPGNTLSEHNWQRKRAFLEREVRRYNTYAAILAELAASASHGAGSGAEIESPTMGSRRNSYTCAIMNALPNDRRPSTE